MASKMSTKLLSSWRQKQMDAETRSSSKPSESSWNAKSFSSREFGSEPTLSSNPTLNAIGNIMQDGNSNSSGEATSSSEEFDEETECDGESGDASCSDSMLSTSFFRGVSTESSMNISDMQLRPTSFSSEHAAGAADHPSGSSSGYPSIGRCQSSGGSSSSHFSIQGITTSHEETLIGPIAGASDRPLAQSSPTGICCHGAHWTSGCSSALRNQPLFASNKDKAFPFAEQEFSNTLYAELEALVRLQPDDFWKITISNKTLHEFLRSYLHFRKRWYDLSAHNIRKSVDATSSVDGDLSRCIFILLYRISLREESSVAASSAMLCYSKLLDISTLMDVCALYGHDNFELTSKLVHNVIKSDPAFEQDLSDVILQAFDRSKCIQHRCSSMIKVLSHAGNLEVFASTSLNKELFEVVDYFHDMIATIDAFLEAYPPAAKLLTSASFMSNPPGGLLSFLASIHDLFVPLLQKGLDMVVVYGKNLPDSPADDCQKDEQQHIQLNTQLQLKRLRVRLVKLSWHLISISYLQITDGQAYDLNCNESTVPVICHGEEHPKKRGSELLQALSAIAAGLDISNILLEKSTTNGSLLYNMQARNNFTSKIAKLQETGYLILDQEKYENILSLLTKGSSSIHISQDTLLKDHSTLTYDEAQNNERSVLLESKANLVERLAVDTPFHTVCATEQLDSHATQSNVKPYARVSEEQEKQHRSSINSRATEPSRHFDSSAKQTDVTHVYSNNIHNSKPGTSSTSTEESKSGVDVGHERITLEETPEIKKPHDGSELFTKTAEKGKCLKSGKQHSCATELKPMASGIMQWRNNLSYEDYSGKDCVEKPLRTMRSTKFTSDGRRKHQHSSRVQNPCKKGDDNKEPAVHNWIKARKNHLSLCHDASPAVSSIGKARQPRRNEKIIGGQLGFHSLS